MKKLTHIAFLLAITFTLHAQGVLFTVQDKAFVTGDTINADLSVYGFTEIAGYNFALKFDTSAFKFGGIIIPDPAPLPNYSLAQCFGLWQIDKGEIRTAWTTGYTETLPDGTPMFGVRLIAKKSGDLSDNLALAPNVLAPAAFLVTLESIPLDFSFVSPEITGTDEPGEIRGLGAYPNPFSGSFTLVYQLYLARDVTIAIADSTGAQIYTETERRESGTVIDSFTFDRVGVFFVSVSCSDFYRTLRVVSR